MTKEISIQREKQEEVIEELLSIGKKIVLEVAELVWKYRNDFFPDKKDHQEFVKYCYTRWGLGSASTSKYERIGDGFYAHGYTPKDFLLDSGKYQDYEVVYEAAKMPLEPEQRYANALTLTRKTEVKQNRADADQHTPSFKEYCDFPGCWLSRDNHPMPDGQAF